MSKSYLLELVENACMQDSFAPCLKKRRLFCPHFWFFFSSSVLHDNAGTSPCSLGFKCQNDELLGHFPSVLVDSQETCAVQPK